MTLILIGLTSFLCGTFFPNGYAKRLVWNKALKAAMRMAERWNSPQVSTQIWENLNR